MKKLLSIFIAAALLAVFSAPVFAANIRNEIPSKKEEVVYGILNQDGSVQNIYVVNSFNSGSVTDYGDYTQIQNLSTSDPLNQNADLITADTSADMLYYRGTLSSKDLPWKVGITYILNGTEVQAEELGGKSGELQINISAARNENVSSTFFESYALQISLQLDTELCRNIIARGATIADAGGKKQISFTALPGNGGEYSLSAEVHDFRMDAISINGIRLVFSLDNSEITEQISQLSAAIKQLDDGAGDLLGGAGQLATGMEAYLTGLKAMQSGLSELSGGVSELNGGAVSLKGGLNELSKQNDTLVGGALAIEQATFDAVNEQLKNMGLPIPALTRENYTAALSNISDLAALKARLDGAVQFTEGIKSYTSGVSELGGGASALAKGTSQLQGAVSALPSSAAALYEAGVQLNTALKQLRDGLSDYKDGTGQMLGQTSGDNISALLESISGGGGETVSFVSEKNTDVEAVQFVLKTAAIERPAAEEPIAAEPVRLSFWQKLLNLFKF